MAAAQSSSQAELFSKACNYYKVANLSKTILGPSLISNLKDSYDLGEELGLGQFGVIRKCSNKLTGELLACKSIARSRLSTADDIQSIKLEIEIMTRLSGHPNVVALKEVYEEEDYVHLVMELCAGGELFNLLEKHGRFSESDARLLFRQLMQVVSYCHDNGVVHRDLKPENILLATKTSLSPIKLADFGLATYIRPGQSLRGTVGSPFYIAPEVLAWGYNQSADVWSAGVILYILLCGMPPFWGKTKSQIFDAVRVADLRFPSNPWDCISTSAKSLIKGMLCKDPCQRLTAKDVLDHSWMRDQGPNSSVLNLWQNGMAKGFDDGKAPDICISRDLDISFGSGAHIACEAQSPTFTCRSSLSSLLVEQSMPFASDGFSFRSCGSSDTLKFCSPVPSMPSFTFLGPSSINEFSDDAYGSLSQAALVSASDEEISGKTEAKRAGGTSDNRILGIHNKRNRTIGVGEREQLDFIVKESVVRWSSCTLIPTSLRSSLVC